jgi:ABC-2 type transport system permease protein
MAQGLVLLGSIAAAGPALWWGWLALTRDVSFAMPSMWAGIGAGLAVLVLGVAVGAAVFQRRGSRLMEFAEST